MHGTSASVIVRRVLCLSQVIPHIPKRHMTSDKNIVYHSIDDLHLWQRNYRQGDIGAIINSIRTFGFNGALRVWRDNVVIAGNHTLMALVEMKRQQEDAPHGVVVDKSGDWLIACVDVSHLEDVEAQAFAIADNRTSELADNDDLMLQSLLSDIAIENGNILNATGYDGDDVDALTRDTALDASVLEALSDDVALPSERNLHSRIIKPVLSIEEIDIFEQAMSQTNESNRAKALMKICQTYLDYA